MGIVWNTLKRLFLPFNITTYIQVHILGHKKAMYTVKDLFPSWQWAFNSQLRSKFRPSPGKYHKFFFQIKLHLSVITFSCQKMFWTVKEKITKLSIGIKCKMEGIRTNQFNWLFSLSTYSYIYARTSVS